MDRGRGRWRRRRRRVRNCWEPNQVNLQVGKATKGTEARGPGCDRIRARSAEAIVGNKRCAFKSTSRQAAATLCQPYRGMPGSSSTAADAVPLPDQPMKATQNRHLAILAHTYARIAGQRRGIRQIDLSGCSCRLRGVCSGSCGCSRPNWPSEQLTWSKQHCAVPIRLQTTVLLQSFSRWGCRAHARFDKGTANSDCRDGRHNQRSIPD